MRMARIIIVFIIMCIFVLAPCVCKAQIDISTVHQKEGDYFIAKHGSRILWRYDSWGPILRDNISAMSILVSSDLLVVDGFGTIRKRLPFNAAHAPRSVFLRDGYLIYDIGDLAIAKYNPKTEGRHLAWWIKKVRLVCMFNVRTLHQQWQTAETDVGLPIAYYTKNLDTMKIVNFTKCLEFSNVTPIVSITEINVRNKHTIRSAVLSIKRTEALELLNAFLGIECVTPARVHWNTNRVHINRLFGRNYYGKIQ